MSEVVRTWKRDGWQNRMSEAAATKNLGDNAIGYPEHMAVAEKRADIARRLNAGGVVHTPMAYFRMAMMLVVVFAASAFAQERIAAPSWYWTVLDQEQLVLWCDGRQIGNYYIEDGTYLPYLGQRQWGVPEDPPCPVPERFLRQLDARKNWRTQGVISPEGRGEVPHTGLHIRQVKPQSQPRGKPTKPAGKATAIQDFLPQAVTAGTEQVPNYSQMGSLTFVSNDDGTRANAAKQMFETAPELEAYRQRFGRVKAYGYEDFQHTSGCFKLDQDGRFRQTGFVALAQPSPPDAEGTATVTPIYECSSPGQFAGALRDARPDYDPNSTGNPLSAWETPHLVAAATFIGVAVVCTAVGLGMKHRPRRLL